jgi:hypothetical protein
MVNNKKINNYYKKKKSPKRNQSSSTAEGDTTFNSKNNLAPVMIDEAKVTPNLTITEGTKPSSLALAAAMASPTATVNATGTISDIDIKEDEKIIDTTMISGVFSSGDSTVVTRQMRYEADEEDNEDDDLGSNGDGNNSTVNTTMHISFVNHLFGPNSLPSNPSSDQNIVQPNKTNLSFEDNTMNISHIKQENDDLFLHPNAVMYPKQMAENNKKIITLPNSTTKVITINTNGTEDTHTTANLQDDGFTTVQNYRKTHQKSSLEQLKKKPQYPETGSACTPSKLP